MYLGALKDYQTSNWTYMKSATQVAYKTAMRININPAKNDTVAE